VQHRHIAGCLQGSWRVGKWYPASKAAAGRTGALWTQRPLLPCCFAVKSARELACPVGSAAVPARRPQPAG